MAKRKRKTVPSTQNKKQKKASSDSTTPLKRIDPFNLLTWDCMNLVLQYLDIKDLARCERVGKGWRALVQHWMVEIGQYYCFPDGWRPDIPSSASSNEAVRFIKESAVKYAAYRKFTSGNASCARRYQAGSTGLFSSSGDFTVWHADSSIFWQNLGFQQDGSLHPIKKLPVRVTGDNLRYLAVNAEGYVYYQSCHPNNRPEDPEQFRHYVVSLGTGERVWKRRALPDTKLFAMGKQRVYFVGTGPQNRYLSARDLKSGRLLYEVPFAHAVRNSKPPVPVQLHGGDEVIVNIHSILVVGNIFVVDGIQIINGKDGQIVQTITTRIWSCGSHVAAEPGRDGGFAILSHSRRARWYVKIQKFTQDPGDKTFHTVSTEVLELGDYPDQIHQIGIEPYRYLAATVSARRALPQVMSIRENPNPTIDEGTMPVNTAMNTDKWLCTGPGQEVTLPQKYKHHKARRLFIPGPLDYRPHASKINFAGWDRLVLFTDPKEFYCLFDFRFRLPNNMRSSVIPDPKTMEMR